MGNKFTVAFKMKFQPRSNNDINNLYCFKSEREKRAEKKIDSKPHMFFSFFPPQILKFSQNVKIID